MERGCPMSNYISAPTAWKQIDTPFLWHDLWRSVFSASYIHRFVTSWYVWRFIIQAKKISSKKMIRHSIFPVWCLRSTNQIGFLVWPHDTFALQSDTVVVSCSVSCRDPEAIHKKIDGRVRAPKIGDVSHETALYSGDNSKLIRMRSLWIDRLSRGASSNANYGNPSPFKRLSWCHSLDIWQSST